MDAIRLTHYIATLQRLEAELMREDRETLKLMPELEHAIDCLQTTMRSRLTRAACAASQRHPEEVLRMQRAVELLREAPGRRCLWQGHGFSDLVAAAEAAVPAGR